MSLIKIQGVASTSAPSKAQKDAAVYMFGSKGHSIVAVLDKFSRAKELRTAHLDGLLKLMKDGEDDEIIKFTASAVGKKSLAAAKAFAVAKTLTASIKALKLIRVPQKWIEGHSDAAAARAQETKEIRARRTAGNKPEKPIKLDNPGAPEAVVVDNVIDITALLSGGSKPDSSLLRSFTVLRRQPELDKGRYFTTLARWFRKQVPGSKVDVTKKGISITPKGSTQETSLELTRTGWVAKIVTKRNSGKLTRTIDIGELFEIPAAKGGKVINIDSAKPKPEAYKPSGKSDITLVDELAEVTARKIAAKPLQAREEYFNALRNVLQKNLPNTVVSTVSNGVTVVGKRDYVINLNDNAWTIKVGVTGKPKKIGATFDVVDLLGMLDKSILRPKA